KALEENNVPIDYIAGTSIGAIVGGLYSLGYSPDEMIDIFKSESFSNWLTGDIDEKHFYYFKGNYDIPSLLKLGFSINDSINRLSYPTNLVDNSPMDFAFMKLFSAAGNISEQSFDDLFVPFRCVASDIYNKKTVIFSKGNLSKAVRSSMAVPFYFKPVVVDSMFLFDGGIYNNFPYDVMISDFNPDFVIGSVVTRNSSFPSESDLIGQIENMIVYNSKYYVDSTRGIQINNLYDNVGLLDFSRVDYFVDRGYKSTLNIIDSIKKRCTKQISVADLKVKRIFFRSRIRELNFDTIEVVGVNPKFHNYIVNNLRGNKGFFTLSNLENEYYKLLFDENIEALSPSAIFNPSTGFYKLKINVTRAKEFKFYLGGNLSSASLNQGYIGLQYNFFRKNSLLALADFQYGRFYSSGSLKFRNYFMRNIPIRLNSEINYNSWDYFSVSNDFFFTDLVPIYYKQREYNCFIDFGFPAYTNSIVELGFDVALIRSLCFPVSNYNQLDILDQTFDYSSSVNFRIESNTLDNKIYPVSGKKIFFGAYYKYSFEELKPGNLSVFKENKTKYSLYPKFVFSLDKYIKCCKIFSLGVSLNAVYEDKPTYFTYTSTLFNAPVFSPTPHSKTLYLVNYRSNKYIAGGLKGIINITDRIHLRVEGYVFAPYKDYLLQDEQLVSLSDNIFPRVTFMGDANFVYHSIIGPLSFSVNYYDRDGSKMFYQLNFGYLLFNRSVLK
ncbi:MAG: patatin-like phospholipase family protein, partial [Bacteroidales bacterium]|nr:patatin-like phospholipase family protein [Bacteroidales bacterium]